MTFIYEVQNGNIKAVDEFMNKLGRIETPLVDEIENDEENLMVTFVYIGEEDNENVLFSGTFIPYFDENDFLEYAMENIEGTNIWYTSYKVRNDIRFMYYFFPINTNDIDCETIWNNMVWDKFNKKKLIWEEEKEGEDLIYSCFTMPKSEEDFWTKERTDIPKGKLSQHEFHSESFKTPHKVSVYTPNGYSEENGTYGYIVTTDAYEYINILFSINVLDNLIADRKIPPIVAVLIDSTDTRYEELTCNDKFCYAVIHELIPKLREKYNLSTNPKEAIICGTSLGGLTATYIGLKYSDVFGKVLSKSGSYWYKPEDYEGEDNECWMSSKFRETEKLQLKFYMNVGIFEVDGMRNTNYQLRETLKEKGYEVEFETFKSGHDYMCWGETFATGLISLIGI